MSKTLILSQRQLDEIIGDSSYLNTGAEGNFRQFPDNEISVGGNTSEEPAKPITGDDFSNQMAPIEPFGMGTRGTRRGGITSEGTIKKKILETNSRLSNRFFPLSSKNLEMLQSIYRNSTAPEDAPGRMTLKMIIDEKGFKYTEGNKLKSTMGRMDKDSSFYQNLGGDTLYKIICDQLKLATGVIRRDKENLSNMGFDNVYQKPGGTKNSGNGKAHTGKNGNIMLK